MGNNRRNEAAILSVPTRKRQYAEGNYSDILVSSSVQSGVHVKNAVSSYSTCVYEDCQPFSSLPRLVLNLTFPPKPHAHSFSFPYISTLPAPVPNFSRDRESRPPSTIGGPQPHCETATTSPARPNLLGNSFATLERLAGSFDHRSTRNRYQMAPRRVPVHVKNFILNLHAWILDIYAAGFGS